MASERWLVILRFADEGFLDSLFDIYCDESCHLEHDGRELMVLGAIALPHALVRTFAERIRDLKSEHGLSRTFEAKWTKVSPAQVEFYLAVVDAFFDTPDVRFRGLVAHGKNSLRHADFGQDHDTWYHKMYWEMLRFVIHPPAAHRIYIDIKDTRGGAKAAMLQDVLRSAYHDWWNRVVERIQIVRSDEIEALQIADLFVGALGYRSRGLSTSTAKLRIVERIEERGRLRLDRTTALSATKLNVFHWNPQAAPR